MGTDWFAEHMKTLAEYSKARCLIAYIEGYVIETRWPEFDTGRINEIRDQIAKYREETGTDVDSAPLNLGASVDHHPI